MQKTGWTIHSFFLVLSDLKKIFTLDVITRGQSITIFLCIGPFLAWWQPSNQPNNRVTLVQACSWPVRRQSFAIWSKCGSYILSQEFWRENRLWTKKSVWANPIKKMTNRIPLTNKISIGGQWVRDSPTKLYLKVLYFKNSTKSNIQEW